MEDSRQSHAGHIPQQGRQRTCWLVEFPLRTSVCVRERQVGVLTTGCVCVFFMSMWLWLRISMSVFEVRRPRRRLSAVSPSCQSDWQETCVAMPAGALRNVWVVLTHILKVLHHQSTVAFLTSLFLSDRQQFNDLWVKFHLHGTYVNKHCSQSYFQMGIGDWRLFCLVAGGVM